MAFIRKTNDDICISESNRADYWKSQDRKYCDFCKCWIADNRPSIDFHEKGRKHQANVNKRLRNITKQSARDQKESEKFNITLKHIESAALEAYQKDVQTNADLSSIQINKKLQEENLQLASKKNKSAWYEARSDDGRTYYWQPSTKESVWEPPAEGYVTINEQDVAKRKHLIKEHNILYEMKLKQEQEADEMEERARIAREKMKERRVVDDIQPVVSGPILPSGKTDAYGQWQIVKTVEPVDLQLPETQEYVEIPAFTEPEPIVKEFKEKVVDNLDGSDVTFKKRKIAVGNKRNMRQRTDD